MIILGISAFYHDSSACILQNGKIVAAAQEERFTRIKHDSSFPKHSIRFVLDFLGLNLSNVDKVVFYEKPFLKFERLLETYLAFAPKGFVSFTKAIPLWIKDKLYQKILLFKKLNEIDNNFVDKKKLYFSEHHLSHAASAFYPSPFEEAIILTIDGVGEWATTTVSIGKKEKIEIKKEIHFPHSLGLLYSAFTYYLGFKVNSGEYKLMGLAPYGEPIFKKKIMNLIDVKEDGSFRLDQSYFNYATGLTMTNKKFNKLFGKNPRNENEEISKFHMDIASSIQTVLEEIILKISRSISKEYGIKNLCLAGGVALNCVANGRILENKIFENIWIQPASGDAGGALGAALAFWYIQEKNTRTIDKDDSMNGSFLGPHYSDTEIKKELEKLGAHFEFLSYDDLITKTADSLSKQKIMGWFQDRMEFGPRALGNRSILADPRPENMQEKINLKIKFRENFRPFAPSILFKDVSNWFNLDIESPYMLIVTKLLADKIINNKIKNKEPFGFEKLKIKRSMVDAITHVDYSARVQTVNGKYNKKFYDLLTKFKQKTNCPLLVNTSFNVRGEPPVNTPKDAFNCFMSTNMDVLVIGNYFLKKENQKNINVKNFKKNFEKD